MIRYKCDDCASVLTIKDSLAGTQGKCPKCKKKFIVPAAPPVAEAATAKAVKPTAPNVVATKPDGKGPAKTTLRRAIDPADLPEGVDAPLENRVKPAGKGPLKLPPPPVDPDEVDAADDDPFGPPTPLPKSRPAVDRPAPANGNAPPLTKGPAATAKPRAVVPPPPADDDPWPEDDHEASAPPAAKKGSSNDFDPADFLREANESVKPKKAPEPEPVEEWDGAGFRPAPKPTAPKNLARFLKRTAEVAGGVAPAPEEEPDQRAPGDPPMLRHRVDAKTTGSAADSANDMINAASSNAKDALTKTAEQNRIRAGQMPEEKPRFDVDAFVYFLKTQVVPLVLGFSVVLVMAIGVYRYTAGGDLPMPHLGHVQGTIKIDGKPAKDVHIQFIPISTTAKSTKGKEIKVRASTGISDENGHYELFYIDNFRGAALGKHTVEITYSDQEGRPMFAPEYGPGNSQSKDVSTGENPPFDFAWNSPARP